MPRKAKKKLFRRGGNQKYFKSTDNLRRNDILAEVPTGNKQYRFSLLFFTAAALTAAITLSPRLTNYISNFLLTMPSSVTLPIIEIPDLSEITIINLPQTAFELPALPEISIPQISLQPPALPDFTPYLIYIAEIIRVSIFFTVEILTAALTALNPQPFIINLLYISNRMNVLTLTYAAETAEAVMTIIGYLDPRPGTVILINLLKYLLPMLSEKIISVLTFINPLPGIMKIWDAEAAVADGFLRISLTLFDFIYSLTKVLTGMFYNSIITIVNLIFTFLYNIYSAVVNTISTVRAGVSFKIGQFNAMLSAVGTLLKPYAMYFVNVFNGTMREFGESADSMIRFSSDVVKSQK